MAKTISCHAVGLITDSDQVMQVAAAHGEQLRCVTDEQSSDPSL